MSKTTPTAALAGEPRRAPERPDGDCLHPGAPWRPPRGSNPPEIAPMRRRSRPPGPSRTSCGASHRGALLVGSIPQSILTSRPPGGPIPAIPAGGPPGAGVAPPVSRAQHGQGRNPRKSAVRLQLGPMAATLPERIALTRLGFLPPGSETHYLLTPRAGGRVKRRRGSLSLTHPQGRGA